MRNTALSVMILSILLLYCANPLPDDNDTQVVPKQIESLINRQESWFTSYITLIDIIGDSLAHDSIIALIKTDTAVSEVHNFATGLNVVLNNGMGGTLLLRPHRGDTGRIAGCQVEQNQRLDNKDTYVLPEAKNTIFISAMYDEFGPADEAIRNQGNELFSQVDFEDFIFYRGSECTISLLNSIGSGDYGFIRLSSHGVPWPSEDSIKEVYFVTGESPTLQSIANNCTDIQNGGIRVITSRRPDKSIKSFYEISAGYFTSHNSFGDNKPFVSMGFCYSYFGGWPHKLVGTSKAGGCTGYNWSIREDKDMEWTMNFIEKMCDTTLDYPYILKDWYESIEPSFYDDEIFATVSIYYNGKDSLAFWKPFRLYALIPSIALCEDTILLAGKNFGDTIGKVLFDNQPVNQVLDWTDSIIEAIVPDGYTQGQTIQVKVAAHDDTTNEKTLLIGSFNMNTADVGLKLFGHYMTSEGAEDNWFDCRPLGKGTLSGSTFSYTINEGGATNKLIVEFNPQNGDLISATFSSVADDGSAHSSFRMAGIKATLFGQSFILWQGDHTTLTQYVTQVEDKINTATYSSELISWMPTGAGGNGSFKIYLYHEAK